MNIFSLLLMLFSLEVLVSSHIDEQTGPTITSKCKVETGFPTFSVRFSSDVTMVGITRGTTTIPEEFAIIPLLAELFNYDNRLYRVYKNLQKWKKYDPKLSKNYFVSKDISNHRIEELGFHNGEINPIGIEELLERTLSDAHSNLFESVPIEIDILQNRRKKWSEIVNLQEVLENFFSNLGESFALYGITSKSIASGKFGPYQMDTFFLPGQTKPPSEWRMYLDAIYGYVKKDRRLCEKIFEPELKSNLTCGVSHFGDPWLYLQPLKFERISERPHVTMYYDVIVEKEKRNLPRKLKPMKPLEKEEFSYGSVYYEIPKTVRMPLSERNIRAVSNGRMSLKDLRVEGTAIGYARKFPADSAITDMTSKDRFTFLNGHSWTIFLNEPCMGGEVVFPKAQLRVKPKRNALLSVSIENFKDFKESRNYFENCPSIIGHQWVLSQRKFHIESNFFQHSGAHRHLKSRTKYVKKLISLTTYRSLVHDEV